MVDVPPNQTLILIVQEFLTPQNLFLLLKTRLNMLENFAYI